MLRPSSKVRGPTKRFGSSEEVKAGGGEWRGQVPLLEDSGLEIEFVPVTQNVHNRNTNHQHQPPPPRAPTPPPPPISLSPSLRCTPPHLGERQMKKLSADLRACFCSLRDTPHISQGSGQLFFPITFPSTHRDSIWPVG